MKVLRSMVIVIVLLLAAAFMSSAGTLDAAEHQLVKLEGKLNINTATVEQLVLLPGIGEKTAEKIVEHRNKNGAFKENSDILNVKGIGEKKLGIINNYLSTKGENTLKQIGQ